MRLIPFFILLLLASCTSQLVTTHEEGVRVRRELDEVRTELADLKHLLKATQVQLEIVEEKQAAKGSSKSDQLSQQLASLEKKFSQIEAINSELRQAAGQTQLSLNQYKEKIQELEQGINSHERRLDEVVKLKSTLISLSKAVGQKSLNDSSIKTYRVKSGDSLEKIARNHKTSIDAIKRINHLSNDRIILGQEIKIPYDE